jgi:uncharacterized membrane protein YdjX (TVP38/TMEM64 family)/rhodanese-related sulfurtransferase
MRAARFLRALLLVVLFAGIAAALYNARLLDAEAVRRVAASAGDFAPLLFVAGYAAATVLFLPGSILTIAGGALFGPIAGTFYSLTGATLGATLAFLIARYLASGWVTRRTGGRLAEFVKGVEGEGWRFVAFVRLVPLFPFNALNYALGLTRIPLGRYVTASYLAMLPGAAAYTYLGYAGREALSGSDTLLRHGLIAIALIAAVLFLPRLVRRLRSAPVSPMLDIEGLERRIAAGEALTIVDVRGPDEYAGQLGHIPGSMNIPLDELPNRLPALEADKQRPIVLVCRTDKRSAKAAALLSSAGFPAVQVLRGGMEQWGKRSATKDLRYGKASLHPQ